MANATCHKVKAEDGPSLFQNGNLAFQAHHVGWIVAGFFTIVATVASFWLVNKHLQWYTNKREQRYIVRILFMVPIYATISMASYLFWNHSTPLLLIRDCYESTVLTAFFYLLLIYLSPDPEEQKAIFRKVGLSREADREARKNGEEIKKWIFPLGFVKWKPVDGLYFLQLQKWGVLQYCVIRPTTTLAAIILDYAGLYCESSLGLGWGHVYITIIVSVSVSIAMYCLIQLYVPVATYLAPHKPLLKLFAIKAVVFLTFWQATGLGVLSLFGVVKNTKYMTAEDINIGIAALLETFEMMLFAFLHIRAFSYKPYRPFYNPSTRDPPPTRTNRLRALGHAMDFRETFREIWVGWLYIWDRMRGREPRPDFNARRLAHLEEALGRTRPPLLGGITLAKLSDADGSLNEKSVEVEVEERVEVDLDGERQWLGLGDKFAYSLGRLNRERSEGLEEQIEQELQRRGFGKGPTAEILSSGATPEKHRRSRSWLHSIYNRLSQSADPEKPLSSAPSKKRHRSRQGSRNNSHDQATDQLLSPVCDCESDDPLPSSLMHSSRAHRLAPVNDLGRDDRRLRHMKDKDVLPPLPTVEEQPRLDVSESFRHDALAPDADNNSRAPRPPKQWNGSPQLLAPPLHSMRSDSLLGRVFPKSAGHDSSVENGPPTDSAQSLLSVSLDGCSPANATPRPRLTPSTPVVISSGYELGMAGERSTLQSYVPHDTNRRHPEVAIPYGYSAQVMDYVMNDSPTQATLTSSPLKPSLSKLHRREFATHTTVPGSPPPLLQFIPPGPILLDDYDARPSSPVFPEAEVSISSPTSLQSAPLLERKQLKRSSARVYTSSPPSRRRRQTLPAPGNQFDSALSPERMSERRPVRRIPAPNIDALLSSDASGLLSPQLPQQTYIPYSPRNISPFRTDATQQSTFSYNDHHTHRAQYPRVPSLSQAANNHGSPPSRRRTEQPARLTSETSTITIPIAGSAREVPYL